MKEDNVQLKAPNTNLEEKAKTLATDNAKLVNNLREQINKLTGNKGVLSDRLSALEDAQKTDKEERMDLEENRTELEGRLKVVEK